MILDWGIGILGSLLVSAAAYSRRSLSASGAAAAVVLGTFMYALGSLAWFGILLAFFISSSILSKLKQKRKVSAESGYVKSGRRDAGQVAANGGIGLFLCISNTIWPDPVWWIVFVGVMATVNADTWATELGGLSKSVPRSIVSGKRVVPGTSGGITLLGLAASAAGGLFIGGAALLFIKLGEPSFRDATHSEVFNGFLENTTIATLPLLMIGLIPGLFGSLADSWLGATLQVMYRCENCSKEVERSAHCERKAIHIRGFAWMSNDVVNAISSIAGGAAALLLFLLV